MNEEKYYIKVSPESLKSDIFQKTYSGDTFGVYSAMTSVLSGGPNGDSLLTGLTIPIIFKQTFDDIGFYSGFDGFILQKDVVNNFVFTADTTNQFRIKVYNTSDEFKKFLKLSTYTINWGDDENEQEPFTQIFPDYIEHLYNTQGTFTITITQKNPWGLTEVKQKVTIPNTAASVNNTPNVVTFTSQGGNWANVSFDSNYIFDGDANNTVEDQVTNETFSVSGYTSSKLNELKLYGPVKYNTAVVVKRNNQNYGRVTEITNSYTAYTIQDVNYTDYTNGKTTFVIQSSGLTEDMITAEPITKEEVLFGVVSSPEIQSQIFIDRGKNSAFEGIQRLGEVDNMGDLVSYGYGFFKIKEQE